MTRVGVVKVALPGYNILDTDPRHYSFHSDYTSIKIFKKEAGTVTIAANGNQTVNITHSIGFFPLTMLYVELTPSSGRWYAAPFFNISSEDTYVSGDFSDSGVNSTVATFKIYNKTAIEKIVNYYYFVMCHDGK